MFIPQPVADSDIILEGVRPLGGFGRTKHESRKFKSVRGMERRTLGGGRGEGC